MHRRSGGDHGFPPQDAHPPVDCLPWADNGSMRATPDVLYHYTTSAGLLGILSSRALWTSNVLFLNDAEELLHASEGTVAAMSAKADELKARLDRGEPEFPNRPLLAIMEGIIMRLKQLQEGGRLWGEVYVTCFCEDGDLLSQWRGYAGSDGYALGFDVALLQPIESTAYMGMNLAQVKYGLTEAIDEITDLAESIDPGSGNHPGVQADHKFLTVLRQLSQVKNPGFREEREWRLLNISDEKRDLRFREGPSGLIPYKTHTFHPESLVSVTIGPGGNRSLRERSVRDIIERFHPDRRWKINVQTSEVPLR